MKLNKNQIQFIDGYLQRNDVIYVDIRAEMIDHIATAVEEKMKVEDIEFHDAFVSYVNSNRKEIFSMNKKTWQSTLPELKNYFRFFLKPKSLFAVILIITLFFIFRETMVYAYLKEDLWFCFLLIFLSYSVLSMIYFYGIKKKRYYFIERTNIVLSILYWINLFIFKPFEKQKYISDVLTIVFMCLFVIYVLYALNQMNKFFNSKMIIKMKLSAEQIERLYQFTRQHYVEYYDLQTELVDHLANAIEEQWQQNPKLSFEEALQIEFKKFGVFGFMDVVEQRQSALNKKYNKLVLNELKTFFSVPKIIGTISAIGIIFYLIKQLQEGFWIVQVMFLALILSYFFGILILIRRNKKRNKQNGKKWLLKEIIFGYSSSAGLINLPIQFAIRLKGENYHDGFLLLFSFLLIVFGLTEYIMLILIPSKAEDFLKETYPEYQISVGSL